MKCSMLVMGTGPANGNNVGRFRTKPHGAETAAYKVKGKIKSLSAGPISPAYQPCSAGNQLSSGPKIFNDCSRENPQANVHLRGTLHPAAHCPLSVSWARGCTLGIPKLEADAGQWPWVQGQPVLYNKSLTPKTKTKTKNLVVTAHTCGLDFKSSFL